MARSSPYTSSTPPPTVDFGSMSRTEAPSLIPFNVLSIKALIFLSAPLLCEREIIEEEEEEKKIGDVDVFVPLQLNGEEVMKTKYTNTSFYARPVRDYKYKSRFRKDMMFFVLFLFYFSVSKSTGRRA